MLLVFATRLVSRCVRIPDKLLQITYVTIVGASCELSCERVFEPELLVQ